jgi:hypothetical protein
MSPPHGAALQPGETSMKPLLAAVALSPSASPAALRRQPPAPAARAPESASGRARATYLRVLTWTFTFFNSVRVVSYLPTLWTLAHSNDSSQHSLWTWCTWFGANLTMSLWLIERNDSRVDRAAVVNLGNTAMCLAVIVLIAIARF